MPNGERLPVEILIHDGIEGIASLRNQWDALYRRAGCEPSLSHAWTHAVASLYAAPDGQIRTIALQRDDTLIGVLPLMRRTVRGAFSHLAPVAAAHNTHSDWLIGEPPSHEIADALVRGIIAAGVEWDRFRMSRILENNALLPYFTAALRERRIRFLLRREPPSYVLWLPLSYSAYLKARTAKFRNHLKRVGKKIQSRRPEVIVLMAGESECSFSDAFTRILAIEQTSWKYAGRFAMSSQSAATEFWRQVGERGWAEGRIHAQFLTLDGRTAAYNLGYIVGDQYSYLQTTFSSEFRAIGAATYLRAKLVEDLIDRGIRVLDFPGEPYEWERQWTTDVRAHMALTAYSGSARSAVVELLDRVRQTGTRDW
jgi:CelD/BcsL family acetyltransferase involved in cellulose biosynthesis